MSGQLPVTKPTALVVLWAFDRDDEGELRPAFEPREMQSEDRAVSTARLMAMRHEGVIAWSRSARPDTGDFGEPKVLFQHGEVPELD
jgi:hypothetical protein